MALNNPITRTAVELVMLLTSLKIVIPLVLITIFASIVATLIPEPTIFRSTWYLSLLGLLSISLLLITVSRVPAIASRGRDALIGVVTTHAGILIVLAGMIYGGSNEFRQSVKLIEGETRVIPELPFALRLEQFEVEYYAPETFSHLNLDRIPKKRQDSTISILKGGNVVQTVVASPGKPALVDGITLLPTIQDTGWYFELVVSGPNNYTEVIPFPPWASSLITVSAGPRVITAHRVANVSEQKIEILELAEDGPSSLGLVGKDLDLQLDHYSISLGSFKPYTAILLYNRPQMPILLVGCIVTFAGLLWHFTHRSSTQTWDRRRPLDHA